MDLKTITATLTLLGVAACGGETKDVKKDVKEVAPAKAADTKPADAKPVDAKTGDAKTGEMACGEGKCGEGKCGGKKDAKGEHACGEGSCGGKKTDGKAVPVDTQPADAKAAAPSAEDGKKT